MTMQPNIGFRPAAAQAVPRGTIMIRPNRHGYTVREADRQIDYARIAEMALYGAGAAFLAAALLHWVLPGSLNVAELVVVKGALSVMFAIAGLLLIWVASRGMRPIVQMDLAKGELRFGTRNLRGFVHLRLVTPLSDVDSLYVDRRKDRNAPGHLCVRLRGHARPVRLVTGDQEELAYLHERICQDVNPETATRRAS